jgi:competence protein ComEC
MAHPAVLNGARRAAWPALWLAATLLWQAVANALLVERERWALWLPVALGAGIATYFGLPFEPPLWPTATLLAVLVVVVVAARARAFGLGAGWAWPAGLAAAFALGLGLASVRSATVAAPVLEQRGVFRLTARIVQAEPRETGVRLLLDQVQLEAVAADRQPARVRVTVRSGADELGPGDRIAVRAALAPPSPPTHPGGFDFARQAFFQRLGAIGYALGAPEMLVGAQGRAGVGIAALRADVTRRILDVLPGEVGAVAAAMLTGLRGSISADTWRDLQRSGLAHLIAISGLHVGLFAGTVFLVVRGLVALVPPLALRCTPKKLAAGVALVAAFGYTLLAGAPVPTQRAFLMYGVGLLAVMIDRNPFSMRLVAAAATAVLLFRPESLVGPSFQMSFAAVVALIAAFESVRRPQLGDRPPLRPWRYLALVAFTTLVASLATAPLALFHFQRLPLLGIVANLVAVPLAAFWIMPAGLLVLMLMPFGLDGPALHLMGQGVRLMLATAELVAAWPAAAIALPQPPPAFLIATVLGGLWLALWQRCWRLFGLAGMAVGLVAAVAARPPDLLVAADGSLVAVRQPDGSVAVSSWERDKFVTQRWLASFGREEAAPWPATDGSALGRLRCDLLGCVVRENDRGVALVRRAEALAEDCRLADLVVSLVPYADCRGGSARSLNRLDLIIGEGAALRIRPDGIAVETVRQRRGERPWVN